MHSLSIAFGPTSTMWRLLFKTKESAEKAWDKEWLAEDKALVIHDDFGQSLALRTSNVHGVMLEDLDASKLGNLAFNLHNAHMQIDWQNTMRNDAKLRTAQMAQGPAMINPMGPNGRFS